VDVEADAGLALFAVAAPPARDVERYRTDVAHLDELHVRSGLDDLAGDLVAEHESLRRGGAPADHVLVAAADVGGDVLEDRAVCRLPADVGLVDARPVLQLVRRVVDATALHLARSLVGDRLVACHLPALRSWLRSTVTAHSSVGASAPFAGRTHPAGSALA